jgi:hypothetical protein
MSMKFRFYHFDELDESTWNSTLMDTNCNLNYYSYFIKYQTLSYAIKNNSGLVYLDSRLVAIFVTYSQLLSNEYSPLSLQPVYFTLDLKDKYEVDKFYQLQIGIKRLFQEYVLRNHKPVSWLPSDFEQKTVTQKNDKVRELVINLRNSEESLFSRLSRNHKRTIKSSLEMGMRIKTVSSLSSELEISNYFHEYKRLHTFVAGKQTRPDASFEFMQELITRGISRLFVSILNEKNISFLYCDSYGIYARGWSQVTRPNLQKKCFPRTLLEWNAILLFKEENRLAYHLGTITSELKFAGDKMSGFDDYKRRFHPSEISSYDSSEK